MKTLRMVLSILMVLGLTSVIAAQDTGQTMEGAAITIGEVTGNTEAYYGQRVTVEGNVDELLNVRAFILGEGGLTNPQLLIISTSGQEFDIRLTQGAQFRVTGTVYPSLEEGGFDQVISRARDAGTLMGTGGQQGMDPALEVTADPALEVTPDPMATEQAVDPAMEQQPGMVGTGSRMTDMSQMFIRGDLHNYTIVEVVSPDDIVFLAQE